MAIINIFLTIFSGLYLAAVVFGVRKGLERWNRVFVPSLFVLLIFMYLCSCHKWCKRGTGIHWFAWLK